MKPRWIATHPHWLQFVATQNDRPRRAQNDPASWQASYPVHAGVATSAEIEDMLEYQPLLQGELPRLILDATERMLSPLLSPFKRG